MDKSNSSVYCVHTVYCVCVFVCVCAGLRVCTSVSLFLCVFTFFFSCAAEGEAVKRGIALACLLSGCKDEDRKWAYSARERWEKGWIEEWAENEKNEGKGHGWLERQKEKGRRAAGVDKWLGEGREADRMTLESLLWANERNYDRIKVDRDGEKN